MSKYTTEVRYICEVEAGLRGSVGLSSVRDVVEKACPKIFDDDIPFFNEQYRLPLERKILLHYYTREISAETVGLWKLWLNNRMREIMPYYNQLYESTLLELQPLVTKKITETYEGSGEKSGRDIGSTSAISDSSGSSTSRRLYSDTPQGALNGVESETYLTNATKNTGEDTAHGTNTLDTDTTNESSSSDEFVREIVGYEGYSPSKLLQEYRDTFINIDLKIIDELADLFFNLW